MPPSRRQLLTATLALGAASFAGCTDGSTGLEPDGNPGETETDDSNGSETKEPDQSECAVENPHPDYDQTDVTVCSDEEKLGSVTAAIADTRDLQYTGLSDTACLPGHRGMLFVYDSASDHTYVMRGMDLPIDIVYADADKTITDIYHAPEPGPDEDGNDQRYPGFGQYVLEVNYDWTTDRGIETGDRLVFES